MTKIFTAVVAGMLAFSCVTDATEDLGIQLGSGANGAGQTELTLSLEESRTFLGEKAGDFYPLYWSEGDQVSVNGTAYTVAVDGQNKAVGVLSNVAEAEAYCIAYPAAPAGKVLFAEEQSHIVEGTTFADGVSTMYGYSESGMGVTLKHLTGVLKFGITGNAVLSKLQVSTIDRAPIAGEFKLDFASGELEATTASESVIEYSFGEKGLQLGTEAQYVHIAVPAGIYDELYVTLYEQGNSGNIMYATVKAGESKPLTVGNVREFKNAIPYTPNAKLFVINSVEKLTEFKAAIEAEGGLDMDAILTEDIDMTDVEWTPIEGYAGTVNGNGYAIKNLTAPLFGATSASFKGLHLENANITITDRYIAGALACEITATDTVAPTVKNCSISGTVTVNNANASSYSRYGTLVGVTYGVKIEDCVNNSSFTITKPYGEGDAKDVSIGGVVGWIREFTKSDATVLYSELNNSVNNGKVSFEDATTSITNLYVGGLTASSSADNKGGKLCNNTNNGEVSVLCKCTTLRLAGISGYAKGRQVESERHIDNNINNGKISFKSGSVAGDTGYVGGVLGNTVDISCSNNHNYGTINLEEGSTMNAVAVGGVQSTSTSTSDKDNSFVVHDCTNNAPINVLCSSPDSKSDSFRVGGITPYTQGDLRLVTNNKEGVITIGGNRNTNGKCADGTTVRIGNYCVAGVCGYKTVDTMLDCTNHADIILSGTITEIHASKVSEFKVSGIVCYTSKDGSDFVSDGTIKLTGTFDCEMQVAGSVGFHYNTLSGDEQSSTKIEVSGTCNKGLVIGGVVGSTYVKVSDLTYNGTIDITKDATIGRLCYIGGGVGKLMTSLKKGNTGHSSPSGVYCKNVTNNGAITVNGTINCQPNIGGCVGYGKVGRDGATYYALSNLTNTASITLDTNGSVPSTNLYLAGCVGHIEGTVTTATNSGAITLSGSSTGGNSYLAGCVADATTTYTLSELTNSAPILASGTIKSARLGGVAGYVGIIENSTNTGSVTYTGTASTDSHCYGISYYSTYMTNCVNGSETDSTKGMMVFNSANGKSVFLGGLSRQCITKAEGCYNYGCIYLNQAAKGTLYAGGLYATGVDDATYVSERIDCHNYGHIYINADIAPTANNNCFIGGMTYRNNNAFSFKNCTNNGDIILKEGIKVGNSIRMGGFIGTMETNKNVTFDNCTNTGDIIVPSTVSCGNTSSSTTGYIRVGGIVGNQSSGTITVKNTIKNSGTINVAGECKHNQNITVGGVFAYTSSAFTADSEAVLINEGEVICGAKAKKGLRVGGVIGAANVTHPAAVSYINTGNVSCTGTFASDGAYIGGVFGNTAASQSNAQCFCEIKADNNYYTGVGHITGTHRSSTLTVTNCKLGGFVFSHDTETQEDIKVPVTTSDFHNFIYGSGEDTDWTGTENYDGCSPLEKKEDIVVPTISIPETPEEGTTEA